MDKHLLEEINIKHFKCFSNFKANGFKRINLIGGKNNVGKTAFMEALFLIFNSNQLFKIMDNDREFLYFEITKLLLLIEENRNPKDFLLEWLQEEFNFNDYNFDIEIEKYIHLQCEKNLLLPNEFQKRTYWNHGSYDISNFRKNIHYNKIYKKNNPPLLNNYTFISICNNNNETIKNMVDDLKLIGKYDYINNLMNRIFNIEKIDVIRNKVMLQQNGNFFELKEFGDGLKQFFTIILVLLTNKNKSIFIDEIENGIHYTLLDKIWEIIFTLAKEQDVQVFTTTHSKEMIESFAKVSKNLDYQDISYIKMTKLDNGTIKAGVRDYEMIQDAINQEHEVRGW